MRKCKKVKNIRSQNLQLKEKKEVGSKKKEETDQKKKIRKKVMRMEKDGANGTKSC